MASQPSRTQHRLHDLTRTPGGVKGVSGTTKLQVETPPKQTGDALEATLRRAVSGQVFVKKSTRALMRRREAKQLARLPPSPPAPFYSGSALTER